MGSNEEYLDNLLKGIDIGTPLKPEKAGDTPNNFDNQADTLSFDIDAMLSELTNGTLDLDAALGLEKPEEEVPEVETEEEAEKVSAITIEDTQDLMEEDIETLLHATKEEAFAEDDVLLFEDADFSMAEAGSDLEEISSLLEKSENNEVVDEDVMSLLEPGPEIELNWNDGEEETDSSEAGQEEETRESRKKLREEKRQARIQEKNALKEQKKAEKEQKKAEKKERMTNLVNLLTEEDPVPEEEKALILSKENSQIIQELDAEDKAKKKRKKSKGEKEEGGEEEEDTGKNKKKKKEKVKKEPKPKKKKEAVPEKPGKKLSVKSVVIIFLFAASIFAAIFLLGTIFSDIMNKTNAIKAFSEKNYKDAYEFLSGLEEDSEDARLFHHARAVLRLERRLESYEQKLSFDKHLEALHSLMKAVETYDEVYQYALNYGAEKEVAEIYGRILGILSEKYGISEEVARAIAACEENEEYTGYLHALVEGRDLGNLWNGGESGSTGNEELSDLLPEEMELPDTSFSN